MFFTVYKITNTVNGKIYIGKHRTKNLNDNYFGSGKLIKNAIKRYGILSFTKEYIVICYSQDVIDAIERILVNEEFIKRDDTYNLNVGGSGVYDCSNTTAMTPEKGKAMNVKYLAESTPFERSEKSKRAYNTSKHRGTGINSIESKKRRSERNIKRWLGATHKPETIQKMRDAKIGYGVGETNSQFGKMWITNSLENKRISKEDTIPDGWRKGRVMKPHGE